MMTDCCTTGVITPYDPSPAKPWDKNRAQHFYRRIGMGASPETINQALQMNPVDLVEEIVNQAINTPLEPDPAWMSWDHDTWLTASQCYSNGQIGNDTKRAISAEWIVGMADAPNRLRFKMAFFWHNHFVSSINQYENSHWMYRYYKNLMENAFGNFKDFAEIMLLDKSIMSYLNANDNRLCEPGDIPNENLAREFYELFTIGPGNYTDDDDLLVNDVTETAKALSGYYFTKTHTTQGYWTYYGDFNPLIDPNCHDDGLKTIFGQQANFDLFGMVDNLFAQKPQEIADFICRKIYSEFVHPLEIDELIISEMKNTFLASNFEIAPVVEQLLKSEHFFEDCFIGAKIKSPAEFYTGLYVDSGIALDTEIPNYSFDINSYATIYSGSGQVFPDNPSAEIYQGDPLSCPSTNMMAPFVSLMSTYSWNVGYSSRQNGQEFFAPPNVGGWDGHHAWLSTTQMLQRWNESASKINGFSSEPFIQNFIETLCQSSTDPLVIGETCLAHYLKAYTPGQIEQAAASFRGSIPQEEFDQGYWNWSHPNLGPQIRDLLTFICQLPEYQLC